MKKTPITTYEQAVTYLYNVPRFTTKNTLEDTRNFLHLLGNPDQTMRIIHVAGTNGKGSVCAYLSSILTAAGNKVALFTSPHLTDIRERITIAGKMASQEEFLDAFLTIYHRLSWEELETGKGRTGYHPTFFEYLFLMAMLIFSKEEPDYCILETGLGGRLDATNAVARKELAVITSIGLDHTQYLGETIREIAAEKAGIMQKETPVVYTNSRPEAEQVFKEYAEKLQIPTFPVSKNDDRFLKIKNKSIDFSLQSRYYGYIRLTLHTIAAYQIENAALAVRAIEVIDPEHSISEQILRDGLAGCCWPGRMEEILPEVYVDGAHNTDGIRAFLDTVRTDGREGKRTLLFSAVQDKDYGRMLEEIISEGFFSSIAITHLQTDRAVSLSNIEKIMKRYPECAYTLYKDTGAALHELLAGHKDERIYIAGSLYLVGEVKEYLEYDKF